MAFGYLVAGVLLYGAVGYGLDRWLGTQFLVVVGILLGEQLSREWLAGAVVAGTLAWLVAHLHGALTARIPAFEAPRVHGTAGAPRTTGHEARPAARQAVSQ